MLQQFPSRQCFEGWASGWMNDWPVGVTTVFPWTLTNILPSAGLATTAERGYANFVKVE